MKKAFYIAKIIYYVFSELIFFVVSHAPATAIAFLVFLKHHSSSGDWLFLILALYIDFFLNEISYLYSQYKCYKVFKRDKANNVFGTLERIDSPIIQQLIETAINLNSNPLRQLFKPEVHIYKSSKSFKYTTYPFSLRSICIVVKKSFNDQEFKDQVALSHELGHMFHAKKRNMRFLVLYSILLLQALLIYYAVAYHYWQGLLITLLNAFIIYTKVFRYKSDIESQADEMSLKIIETYHDKDKMKEAAEFLAKMRIQEARNNKKPMACHSLRASIVHYSYFLNPSQRARLRDFSIQRTRSIMNDNYDDSSKKNHLKFERWLSEKMRYLPSLESSKQDYMSSIPFTLCISISYFTTAWLTYKVVNNPHNYLSIQYIFDNRNYLFVIFATLAFMLLLMYLLKTMLWKKMYSIVNQSGI